MLFLQTYGLSASLTAKISKHYKDAAEAIIRDNPYRLIDDIEGVGFKTADAIALSLGFPRDGDYRLMSGIKYLLREFTFAQGHTYVPRAQLVRQAAQLLGAHEQLLDACVSRLILQKDLVAETLDDDEAIFVPDAWFCEQEIAKRLLLLSAVSQTVIPQHVSDQITAFEKEKGIQFSPTQRSAVLEATQTGVLVITGGPGTGKTTLLNCILHILGDEEQCLLAAPTGRAAKRMSEATGREAKTIHRLSSFTVRKGPSAAMRTIPGLQLPGDRRDVDGGRVSDAQPAQTVPQAPIWWAIRIAALGGAGQCAGGHPQLRRHPAGPAH